MLNPEPTAPIGTAVEESPVVKAPADVAPGLPQADGSPAAVVPTVTSTIAAIAQHPPAPVAETGGALLASIALSVDDGITNALGAVGAVLDNAAGEVASILDNAASTVTSALSVVLAELARLLGQVGLAADPTPQPAPSSSASGAAARSGVAARTALATASAGTTSPTARPSRTAPGPVRSERPEGPDSPAPPPPLFAAGPSADAEAFSFGGFAFAALLVALLTLASLVAFGRLQSSPARWRPVAFVSLLERPG